MAGQPSATGKNAYRASRTSSGGGSELTPSSPRRPARDTRRRSFSRTLMLFVRQANENPGGAKRGANGDRLRATLGDVQRRLVQLAGTSDRTGRRSATDRARLTSEGSLVRTQLRPPGQSVFRVQALRRPLGGPTLLAWSVRQAALLGSAHEAGVVTAQDQCTDAAAGFICWQADEALFEVAGHGVGVAWACVPGRGGDHLVGRDFALAQLYPVHQGAASGVGVAESLRIVVDVCRLGKLECWLAEAGLQLVQPLAHQVQVCRGAGPAHELPYEGAGAVYGYEVSSQRVAGDQQ